MVNDEEQDLNNLIIIYANGQVIYEMNFVKLNSSGITHTLTSI